MCRLGCLERPNPGQASRVQRGQCRAAIQPASRPATGAAHASCPRSGTYPALRHAQELWHRLPGQRGGAPVGVRRQASCSCSRPSPRLQPFLSSAAGLTRWGPYSGGLYTTSNPSQTRRARAKKCGATAGARAPHLREESIEIQCVESAGKARYRRSMEGKVQVHHSQPTRGGLHVQPVRREGEEHPRPRRTVMLCSLRGESAQRGNKQVVGFGPRHGPRLERGSASAVQRQGRKEGRGSRAQGLLNPSPEGEVRGDGAACGKRSHAGARSAPAQRGQPPSGGRHSSSWSSGGGGRRSSRRRWTGGGRGRHSSSRSGRTGAGG